MKSNELLSIYHYSSAATYLKDKWLDKKRKNPSFSMRSWSKKLGFSNNAPLSLMLSGKRPIPKKYIPAFIESLHLNFDEGSYLETLIDFERHKKPEQKEFYFNKLKSMSPKTSITSVEVETFKYFGNPLCMTILEMSELPDFKATPKWILNRISFKSSLLEIKECLKVLESLGLFYIESESDYKKTHKHITNKKDVADSGSQKYHKSVSLLASEAIKAQNISEREFNGYALNIEKSKIPKAKKLIRNFIKEFISEIEAKPSEGDETFQFNIQLFQLTNNKEKK